MRLQHVTAPSALATSLASTVAMRSPRRSSRSRVRGKDVGYWIDDLIANPQGVGRRRFVRMHVDAVEGGERSRRPGRQPRRIGQQQIVADRGCRGLQVQAPLRVNGGDFVAVRFQHTAHLIDAGVVRPARSPDEYLTAHHKHVPAVSGARCFHSMQRPIFLQRVRDPGCLGAPGCRAGTRDDRHLVEDDRRVFDEHGVRHVRPGGKPLDPAPRVAQTRFVRRVLRARQVDVYGLPLEMRQLAARNRRTDVASEGYQHGLNLRI